MEFKQLTPSEIKEDIDGLSVEATSLIAGVPKAFVTYQGMSGDVTVGMIGRSDGTRPTLLLPLGWQVVQIDPVAGMLVIRKGLGTAKLFVGGQAVHEVQPLPGSSSQAGAQS